MEVPRLGGPIGAVAAGLHHSHGNAGSLTHGARPGIEPATSWFLVGFVNHCATMGTPLLSFKVSPPGGGMCVGISPFEWLDGMVGSKM